MTLEFRMLGPLEVARDGRSLDLGPTQQRAVLCVLLIQANRVVSTDRLLDDLWGEQPPKTAPHALQVHISKLRKLLEPDRPPGAPGEVLVTRSPGYVLLVPPESRDAPRFEALAAEGRSALRLGRFEQAAEVLAEGLALWRGPALADFAYRPFAEGEAARLEELRLAAVEDRIEADLALGRHAGLVGELESWVREHPLRERLWAQLMLALYRSGRQADALRAYQTVQATLREELGLDPGPELRNLEEAILGQAPELAGVAEPSPQPPPQGRGSDPSREPEEMWASGEELKVATALFADLVGSTALGERLEPEHFKVVVEEAVAHMVAAVDEFGGTLMGVAGDGIFALFGAPRAHEDDPDRAVRAGLRIVEATSAYGEEVARAWEVDPLRVRVGIHTGPVVVGPLSIGGQTQYQAKGDAINSAARLQAVADAGAVLTSEATRRLVEPLFEWGEARPVTLKGKRLAIVASPALSIRPQKAKLRGIQGLEVELVGRDHELAILEELLASLSAGVGGVLFVAGEAGVGKSRLLAELRERFAKLGRGLWLEGRCLSYGRRLPYWPFRELLLQWLGTSPNQPHLRARVTLRAAMQRLIPEGAPQALPALEAVLGVEGEPGGPGPPEAIQQAIPAALGNLLERLAGEGPVAVAIDDLHWADPDSLELLERLLPVTERAAVSVVLALRPERGHPSWAVREAVFRDLAHRAREVRLEPLRGDADLRMLQLLAGADVLPAEVSRRLLEVAEGNPFYLEELVRSLMTAGALVRSDGGWRFDHEVPTEIPHTVEQVIVSRIDRLDARCREVLTAASVLGRQWSIQVLEGLGEGPELEEVLGELQRLDLLRQARRWPHPEYRFHHGLIQEAAYRTLVSERRRRLHHAAAQAMERIFADSLPEVSGELAHHWQEAGDAERALPYQYMAAEEAWRIHAVDAARAHYSAALERGASLDTEEARRTTTKARLGRGRLWRATGEADRAQVDLQAALEGAQAIEDRAGEMQALEELAVLEVEFPGRGRAAQESFEAALDLAERLGDQAGEVSLLNRLAIHHANQLRLDRALDQAQRALALAEGAGDERLRARAMDGLKLINTYLGDFPSVRRLVPELEQILRRTDDLWYLQFVLAEWSVEAAAGGRWDEALGRLDEALTINERGGFRADEPLLRAMLAWTHRSRGAYGDALEQGRAAVALADELDSGWWRAWAEANLGAILLELRAPEEAIPHLERGMAAARRSRIRTQLVRCAGHLAWAQWLREDHDAYPEHLHTAQSLLRELSAPPGATFLYGADAHTAVARLHLARGDLTGAQAILAPLVAAARAAGWVEHLAHGLLLLGVANSTQTEALLREAVAVAERSGLLGLEWQARSTLGGLLRSAGRAEEGEQHLARAAEIIEVLAASIPDEGLRESFVAGATAELRGE
ncbi:MAG: BTAD domain-containing putative transcriptional regulator [Acidimicrobiia bacterium]